MKKRIYYIKEKNMYNYRSFLDTSVHSANYQFGLAAGFDYCKIEKLTTTGLKIRQI